MVTAPIFFAIFVATVGGALVQGSIGFGMNLVIVAVTALVLPEALPVTAIFLAVPLVVGMIRREHEHVDWRGAGWITVGRLPGTALGVWLVAVASVETLTAVVGAAVLMAVLMSAVSPPIPINRSTAAATGAISGAMGTASSIGGPPLALLYQRESGPTLRSTLAVTFAIGTAMSLSALGLAGQVRREQFLLALALTPAVIIGLWLSRRVQDHLDGTWLRPSVLVFAAATGALTLLRAVL